jgi:excisionase family DNA binding protein
MQLGTGGRDVFTSEVYLVNMREFTDQKWGTPQPITLRDSEFGLVRLRGFGQYSMQIADPKLFVDKVVGTQGLYTTAQIEDYLRGAIVSRMTDVLGSNMTSVLDLPKMYDDLNAAVRAKVASDFAAMGIDLKQFMIVNMSPTEETAKAIDERASMGAIGNLDAYMKFKAAQAMGDAAKAGGDAGAGLSLGAGIGMGTGMAGMVASAMQSAQSSSAAAAQPAAAPTASSVMTVEEAAAYLKVAPADIQAMIASGDLRAKKIGEQYRISKETIDSFLNS